MKSFVLCSAIFASLSASAGEIKEVLNAHSGWYEPVSECSISFYRKAAGLGTTNTTMAFKAMDITFDEDSTSSTNSGWLRTLIAAGVTSETTGNVTPDVGGRLSWTNPMMGASVFHAPATSTTRGHKETLTIQGDEKDVSLKFNGKTFFNPRSAYDSTEDNIFLKRVNDHEYLLNTTYSYQAPGDDTKTSIVNCLVRKN